MKKLLLVLPAFLMMLSASAQTITSSVGTKTVSFKLVQVGKTKWMDVQSNEIENRKLKMDAVNEKYFKDTLKDACYRSLIEVGCNRYSIVIEHDGPKKIKCTFCYNSDVRQAKVARNALQVFSMAVNTGVPTDPQ